MNQLHVIGKQKIGDFEFVAIEGGFGESKKAMTVKDIAGIHNREVKVINQAINMNIKRFIDGVDIIDLKSKVNLIDLVENYGFEAHSVRMSKNIYILSERGYAKLLKILEDDTAWEIYDQLVDNYFSYRKKVKSIGSDMSDLDIRRANATARLENAKARKAKLLTELAKDATTEVNKALLQDKAVEVLTGSKLLEMPKLKQKLYDTDEIAKKLGVLSKSGQPHGTAVSQIIQRHIHIEEGESEILPESKGSWSGSVIKYGESVIKKVREWLEKMNYPSQINGGRRNYHVTYDFL
ncbi:ORF6N domain-containing protein [Enterococcus faecalis]|uniref:ORF6N domain-containing protein n=1 Tax=Enterococcus faecalis TaxID=1351 RepID=UPI0025B17BBB|nr:ORF6N domain-containing protein [Enterococcus faecalis]MDN3202190.1 ORF6N domain-containing protein [Enterococcus faecalis]